MVKTTDFKLVSVTIKQWNYRKSNIVNHVVTRLMTSRNVKVKVATRIYFKLNIWTTVPLKCSNGTDTTFSESFCFSVIGAGWYVVNPAVTSHTDLAQHHTNSDHVFLY